MPYFTTWDQEQSDRLRQLWDQGYPASEIGEMMGRTKNQIVGRAHRLHLPSRGSPIRRSRKRRALGIGPGTPPGPLSPLNWAKHQKAQDNANARKLAVKRPILTGLRGGCQFITGEPSGDDSCKCGATRVAGTPYCATHRPSTIMGKTAAEELGL